MFDLDISIKFEDLNFSVFTLFLGIYLIALRNTILYYFP